MNSLKICANCDWCDKTKEEQAVLKCKKDNHSVFLTDSCEKYKNTKGEQV